METYFSPSQWTAWNHRPGCDSLSEIPTTETKSSSQDASHLTTSFASSLLDLAFRRDKRSRRESEHRSSTNLSNVSIEELENVLEPIVRQLKELDAESLLHLTRVSSGGARLKDGYVPVWHSFCTVGGTVR
jgi:hypothetical protein